MWEKINNFQDKIIIEYYRNFVGETEVKVLLDRFDINKFCGKWDQVMTSLSTGILGTGIGYTSVQANYSLNEDDTIKVINSAYDNNFKFTIVEGKSRSRSPEFPVCRTVSFPSVSNQLEGDYWIIYISPSFNTIIVCSPLILPVLFPIKLSDNFALYVLAKDTDQFWTSPEETKGAFDALEKYGFTNLINKPFVTGESFPR